MVSCRIQGVALLTIGNADNFDGNGADDAAVWADMISALKSDSPRNPGNG